MKSYLIIALAASLLMACGGSKKPETLAEKKEALTKLKAQQVELNTQIKSLETDVAKADPKKAAEAKVKEVAVTVLNPSTFRRFVELQGTVDAKNNVQVNPKMGGVITAMYVKEGDAVRAGSVIARVDDAVMRESVAEIQNQLSLATTVYERQSNLWKQQIGTEIQYLQAKNNKEGIERRLATLRTQMGQSAITSPISGVVDQVTAKVGQTAMPGMGLARVVNLSKLKIVAKVADTYAGSVRKGDALTVRFPDLNRELKTTISFVAATVDPVSRTFTIEGSLPSDNSLKPNMLAQVRVNDLTKANALVIDQNLVQNTEKGQLVYVAETVGSKKIAKARTIKTGLSYNGQIEITAGLRAGDQLITQGYQDVTDGQAINF
jgi:membrane fusion protein, multidrug efflux system